MFCENTTLPPPFSLSLALQLIERLRGSTTSSSTDPATTISDSTACSSIFRRSSSSSGGDAGSNGKEDGCADGGKTAAAAAAGGGILEGLESGSAVRGPQCSVCDQYCFLTAVVCDTCDSAANGRAPARASSSGSPATGVVGDGGAAAARRRHSRRRFACGRHLADLCACPASGYTYYQRKDAGQLRRAAKDLTSSEEQTEAWVEEAKAALAVAKGTGGGMVNSFRLVKAKNVTTGGGGGAGGGGDGGGVVAAGAEDGAVSNGKVKLEPRNLSAADANGDDAGAAGHLVSSSPSAATTAAGATRPPLDGADARREGGGAAAAGETFDEMDLQLEVSAMDEEDDLPPPVLAPAGRLARAAAPAIHRGPDPRRGGARGPGADA